MKSLISYFSVEECNSLGTMKNESSQSDLPPAWLVVGVYPDGDHIEIDNLSTKEEAEASIKNEKREYWTDNPTFIVRQDSPDYLVRVDGIYIRHPHHLTMRENWLGRNQERLATILDQGEETTAFTWRSGPSEDLLATKMGGRAPRPANEPWPACHECGKPLLYIGTLNFNDTPIRSHVPGDALTFFYCEECILHEYAQLWWLSEGQVEKLWEPPQGAAKEQAGVAWAVTDYPWREELFYDDYGEPVGDEIAFVHSPFLCLTVYGTKIDGHVFWVQNDETPACSCGKPMRFIGQTLGGDEVEFGDSGVAYFFHCAEGKCGETKVIIQCF